MSKNKYQINKNNISFNLKEELEKFEESSFKKDVLSMIQFINNNEESFEIIENIVQTKSISFLDCFLMLNSLHCELLDQDENMLSFFQGKFTDIDDHQIQNAILLNILFDETEKFTNENIKDRLSVAYANFNLDNVKNLFNNTTIIELENIAPKSLLNNKNIKSIDKQNQEDLYKISLIFLSDSDNNDLKDLYQKYQNQQDVCSSNETIHEDNNIYISKKINSYLNVINNDHYLNFLIKNEQRIEIFNLKSCYDFNFDFKDAEKDASKKLIINQWIEENKEIINSIMLSIDGDKRVIATKFINDIDSSDNEIIDYNRELLVEEDINENNYIEYFEQQLLADINRDDDVKDNTK